MSFKSDSPKVNSYVFLVGMEKSISTWVLL